MKIHLTNINIVFSLVLGYRDKRLEVTRQLISPIYPLAKIILLLAEIYFIPTDVIRKWQGQPKWEIDSASVFPAFNKYCQKK